MDQSDVDRVINFVRRHIPASLDAEDIAVGILVETWSNKVDRPSRRFMLLRCHDAVRSFHREKNRIMKMNANEPEPQPSVVASQNDQVNTLMSLLDNAEKKVIFYRFYRDYSITTIAAKLKLSAQDVREALHTALFKMRSGAEDS